MWRFYCDDVAHGMWAVECVNNEKVFHVMTKDEAIDLCGVLNSYYLNTPLH